MVRQTPPDGPHPSAIMKSRRTSAADPPIMKITIHAAMPSAAGGFLARFQLRPGLALTALSPTLRFPATPIMSQVKGVP
jgi:hypothetical protein